MVRSDPLPTFVVGVGQAGIAVMETLQEKLSEDERDFFDFLVLDSSMKELNDSPIEKVRYLETPSNLVGRDIDDYPYLTDEMAIGATGAERQRPVGRYKLDNPEGSFSDHFRRIDDQLDDFRSTYNDRLRAGDNHINIFLVHSLGGGTGSGTFPLLTGVLHYIAEKIRDDNQFAYFAGVGVVPEFDYGLGVKALPAVDMRYYPNTYAALSDLDHLLSVRGRDPDDPLRLPVWSRRFDDRDGSSSGTIDAAMSENAFEFETQPFNDYYLVGVDEDRISGRLGGSRTETYADVIDNTIAEGLYTVSKLGAGMENISGVSDTDPLVGTIAQAEVAVDIEHLREYCETQDRIDELTDILYAGRDPEAFEAESDGERDAVERIVRNPEVVLETLEDEENEDGTSKAREVENDIHSRISRTMGEDMNMLSREVDKIDEVVDRVREEYDLRYIPMTVAEIERRLEELVPKVKRRRQEVVSDLWSYYDLSSDPQFGGASGVAGKSTNLEDFLHTEIESNQERLQETDPSFWDGKPLKDGARETLEGYISEDRQSLEELSEVQDEHSTLERFLRRVDTLRHEAESDLRDKRSGLETAKADLRDLTRLLTEDRRSPRVGYLPISEDRLEGLTTEQLEGLGNLKAFVDNDFIDEDQLRDALASRFQSALAGDERILSVDDERPSDDLLDQYVNMGRTQVRTYVLYNEVNEQVVDLGRVSTATSGINRNTTAKDDPYSVTFVSYARMGPLTVTSLYQDLHEYAEGGDLDRLVPEWDNDHRRSFAYLEWYDKDVRRAFEISDDITLHMPPELDVDAVDRVGLGIDTDDEGEFKNELVRREAVTSYLYQGVDWDGFGGTGVDFEGWREDLDEVALQWQALRNISPGADEVRKWLGGRTTWEELLEEYAARFEDLESVKVTFQRE